MFAEAVLTTLFTSRMDGWPWPKSLSEVWAGVTNQCALFEGVPPPGDGLADAIYEDDAFRFVYF